MGRLIDADALIEFVKEELKQDRPHDFKIRNIQRFIKDMPTAYDVEKVVKQLEEETIALEDNYGELVECIPKNLAIDIVRKGGV